nr:hypothetical protein [Xanthomonas citri]
MDVEIHDGDALQPMPVARMGGATAMLLNRQNPIDTCAVAW